MTTKTQLRRTLVEILERATSELFNVSRGGPMTLAQADAMNRALARIREATEMMEQL